MKLPASAILIVIFGALSASAFQDPPLEAGDLVFRRSGHKIFGESSTVNCSDLLALSVGHVGVYEGNGKIIHALGWEFLGIPLLFTAGKVVETDLEPSSGVPSFYESHGDEDGAEDHDRLGAKTHVNLWNNPDAQRLRDNIIYLAREQLGEGYDNGGGQQKGPGDDEWICSGFVEKLYESANGRTLIYPSPYGSEVGYEGGLNITPDGYVPHGILGTCYFETTKEFSQLTGVFGAGTIWGRQFTLFGSYYAFFPYTQYVQPTLRDAFKQFPQITVQVSPSGQGLKFTADGTQYSNAGSLSWLSGSSHTLSVTATQTGNDGKAYNFQKWSDGNTSTSRTITPSVDAQYTAIFAAAEGEVLTRTAAADAYVRAAYAANNYGIYEYLFLSPSSHSSGQSDALIRFDLAAIPTGSTVKAAELRLTLSGATVSDMFEVWDAANSWTETAVKWNNRPTRGSLLALMRADTPTVVIRSADFSALANAVQRWVNNPGQNYGFYLDNFSGPNLFGFYSRETSDSSRRPTLVVSYAPPGDTEGDTITGLGARTTSGGTTIPENTWQWDNAPYFYWNVPSSVSPIVGYSFALDAQPDNAADVTVPYYQYPPGSLGNGTHTFYVKSEDANGNWGPAASFVIKVDREPPSNGTIAINNGAASTGSLIVTLDTLGASDAHSGVDQMRFSNDGASWSPWEPLASGKSFWDLSGYGGSVELGLKRVFVDYRDAAGNRATFTDTIDLGAVGPMIAWWRMEDHIGGGVPDASGRGHTATINGSPTFGYAPETGHGYVQFDNSSWLTVADADDLDLSSDWTMAFWVRPGSNQDGSFCLAKNRAWHGTEGAYCVVLDGAPPHVEAAIITQDLNNPVLRGGVLDPNSWAHVGVVFKAANSEMSIFLNGVLQTNATLAPLRANTYPLIMGGQLQSDGVTVIPQSLAALADVRIYSHVLSASEVWELYITLRWTNGVPLLSPRNGFGVAVGADGKLYAIGGNVQIAGHNTATALVERFDEATQQWETAAPLPFAVHSLTAARDRQGRIWAFGGTDETNIYDTILRYEPRSNQWVSAGTMPVARMGARATTDSAGRIYVVGGMPAEGQYSALAHRFDPDTGQWTALPPLQQARAWHALLIDSLDRIYAIGGATVGGPSIGSVERFDPAHPELGWVLMSPMPTARIVQGTVGSDGQFYLVGGWLPGYTAVVERYNPATDSWSAYASLNEAKNNMGVVMGLSGRIYVMGGDLGFQPVTTVEYTDPYPLNKPVILGQPQNETVNAGGSVSFVVTATGIGPLDYQWRRNGTNLINDSHISGATSGSLTISNAQTADAGAYTVVVSNSAGPTSSQGALLSIVCSSAGWSNGVPLLSPRNGFGVAVGADGKLYAIGGNMQIAGQNAATTLVERFDETTQQWETAAPLPFAVHSLTAARDRQGRIWAFGGTDETNIYDTILRYEPRSNQWVTAGTMPVARMGARATTDSAGRIYVVGGMPADGQYSALAHRFDPDTGQWTALPLLQQARAWHALLVDSLDRIYTIGGAMGGGGHDELNSVERFDPAHPESGWVLMSPMPTARLVQGTVGSDGLFYLVGGWRQEYTAVVERYNPATDSWSAYASLNEAKNNMGVVMGLSGRIYVMGGDLGFQPVTTVEYTDPCPVKKPAVLVGPVSQVGYWGKCVTFSVAATNSPLSYQWFKDGTPVSGATNASLGLCDLKLTDAGSYSVVVCNEFGCTTSSAAILIVNPAGVSLCMYAGLAIDGVVGRTYRIQHSPDITNWTTLTNITLTSSPQVWIDMNSCGQSKGFYRVAIP